MNTQLPSSNVKNLHHTKFQIVGHDSFSGTTTGTDGPGGVFGITRAFGIIPVFGSR
jgi:hypothetical protein